MSSRKPKYSIKDLAEILKIEQAALNQRIARCEEKPKKADFNCFKSCFSISAKVHTDMYEKDEFLAWHRRHYGHLENKRGAAVQ